MKFCRRLLGGMAISLIPFVSLAGEVPIRIEDPWIREAPPVANVLAGYMRIENEGSSALVLKGVSSPAFEHVMLHGTRIEDGIAEMFHLDQVEIRPGDAAVFEPGGNHFMLMGRKRPLRAGDTAVLKLEFQDGGTVSVSVEVRKVGADATMHH